MTSQNPQTPDLAPANTPFVPRLMLATDLDGTFLAGSPAHRQQLYRLVDRHPEIRLTFVTGRGLEAVMPLLSDPSLPRPDYVICDVGGTDVKIMILRQGTVADFRLNGAMSRLTGSSMTASLPCGAISSAMAGRCRSVPVRLAT